MRRPETRLALTLLTAIIGLGAMASALPAQSSYNRAMRDLSIVPEEGGGYRLYALWEVCVESSSVPLDLGLNVQWNVNGLLVESTEQAVTSSFASPCFDAAGGCLTGPCGEWIGPDGEIYEGQCRQDPVTDACQCCQLFYTESEVVELQPGDEIMVLLMRLATALPEPDMSDNGLSHIFEGPVAPTTRRVIDLSIVPSPTGGDVLQVEWATEVGGVSGYPVDLSTTIEVVVGGAVVASVDQVVEPPTGGVSLCEGCPLGICAMFMIDGDSVPGECTFVEDVEACVCRATVVELIPIPTITEGVIILRPVPGALPELPGFPDDEGEIGPEEFIRGDCNHDGQYNIADVIALLDELFGQGDPAPCDDACDGNDDGAKDLGDGIYLLSDLFGMGPPPPAPHPDCGPDPTDDTLTCDFYLCLE